MQNAPIGFRNGWKRDFSFSSLDTNESNPTIILGLMISTRLDTFSAMMSLTLSLRAYIVGFHNSSPLSAP